MIKSFYIIVNSHANFGNAKKQWQQIKQYLDEHKINYRSQETATKGDAKQFAMSFLKSLKYNDFDKYVILVIGGTGTLNEVLTGIKDANKTNIPISFISVGQHHQFANQIGIAHNPITALKQTLNATEAENYSLVQYYESNHEETGYFLDSYLIGLEATLSSIRNKNHHSWMNSHFKWLSNFNSICKAYYNSLDSFDVTLRIGHQYKKYKKAFLLNLYNHTHETDFSKNDNSLEIVIIDKINIFTFLLLLLSSHFYNSYKLPFIHSYHTDNVHITVNSLEQTQIDSRDIGGKYNDLYLKIVEYPFWLNIDSVSLDERRKK